MLDRRDLEPVFFAPFVSSMMRVESNWIDYNGHLNMAYYNVLFDRAVDEVFELLGCGAGYVMHSPLGWALCGRCAGCGVEPIEERNPWTTPESANGPTSGTASSSVGSVTFAVTEPCGTSIPSMGGPGAKEPS